MDCNFNNVISRYIITIKSNGLITTVKRLSSCGHGTTRLYNSWNAMLVMSTRYHNAIDGAIGKVAKSISCRIDILNDISSIFFILKKLLELSFLAKACIGVTTCPCCFVFSDLSRTYSTLMSKER